MAHAAPRRRGAPGDEADDGLPAAAPGLVGEELRSILLAAAANLAARLGYGTTGFTPPVVIPSSGDRSDGPRLYVGRGAVSSAHSQSASEWVGRLQPEEGVILALGGDLAVLGRDDAGLLAAAEAYASRSPYVSQVPDPRLP